MTLFDFVKHTKIEHRFMGVHYTIYIDLYNIKKYEQIVIVNVLFPTPNGRYYQSVAITFELIEDTENITSMLDWVCSTAWGSYSAQIEKDILKEIRL